MNFNTSEENIKNVSKTFETIKKLNQQELDSFLIGLCGQPRSDESSAIKILEFIFLSNELTLKANIHVDNDDPLRVAATAGNVEIFKFLLTDPRLQDKADITAHKFSAYRRACAGQNSLEVLKYMLKTPEIREKIDLSCENHNSLIRAFRNNRTENIHYLLWEGKYPIDDSLKKVLIENGNKSWLEYIETFLSFKEKEAIKDKLHQDLSNEKSESIKLKL